MNKPTPVTKPAAPKPRATLDTIAADIAALRKEAAEGFKSLTLKPALATQPIVYDAQTTLESLTDPRVRPINLLHISYYHTSPHPNPHEHKLKIDPRNIQIMAKLCRDGGVLVNDWQKRGVAIVGGAKVILDYESILTDPKDVPIFTEYTRIFREAYGPGLQLGMWPGPTTFVRDNNLDWTWLGNGPTKEQIARIKEDYAKIQPITDQCDFIVGGMYINTDFTERDLAAYPRANDFLQSQFPDKPLHFFITPRNTWQRVDPKAPDHEIIAPDVARRVFDVAKRYPFIVLWCGDDIHNGGVPNLSRRVYGPHLPGTKQQ